VVVALLDGVEAVTWGALLSGDMAGLGGVIGFDKHALAWPKSG